jgi:hypothetical protein
MYAPTTQHNTSREYRKHTSLVQLSQHDIQGLIDVDVHHREKTIQILGTTDINSHKVQTHQSNVYTCKLHELYEHLPSSLKQLCGKAKLPTEGGKNIIQYISETNTPLKIAADASIKNSNGTHAWIITTNN